MNRFPIGTMCVFTGISIHMTCEIYFYYYTICTTRCLGQCQIHLSKRQNIFIEILFNRFFIVYINTFFFVCRGVHEDLSIFEHQVTLTWCSKIYKTNTVIKLPPLLNGSSKYLQSNRRK